MVIFFINIGHYCEAPQNEAERGVRDHIGSSFKSWTLKESSIISILTNSIGSNL